MLHIISANLLAAMLCFHTNGMVLIYHIVGEFRGQYV